MTTELLPRNPPPLVIGLYQVPTGDHASRSPKQLVHRFDKFEKDCISIGRARTADIKLFDRSVSTVHCYVIREESEYVIEDRHSRNGVVIADVRVQRFPLRPGLRIMLGRIELYVMGESSDIPITASTYVSFLANARHIYGTARAASKNVGRSYMSILRAERERLERACMPEECE